MGATITTMSKTLECSLNLKRSLSNNPGCQTTSAELQDSHHNSDSKSGTQTHWAVLQGPEGEGGAVGGHRSSGTDGEGVLGKG